MRMRITIFLDSLAEHDQVKQWAYETGVDLIGDYPNVDVPVDDERICALDIIRLWELVYQGEY